METSKDQKKSKRVKNIDAEIQQLENEKETTPYIKGRLAYLRLLKDEKRCERVRTVYCQKRRKILEDEIATFKSLPADILIAGKTPEQHIEIRKQKIKAKYDLIN